MNQTLAVASNLSYLALMTLSSACAMNVATEEDLTIAGEVEESIDETSLAVVAGNWTAANLSNGSGGQNPYLSSTPGKVICQAYDYRDNRWHPGKLWAGTCRYEWGGQVAYALFYSALQKASPNYYLEWNPGHTPANAVGSFTGLPVCLYQVQGGEWVSGKVWIGTCLAEWGDQASSTTQFYFLVQ